MGVLRRAETAGGRNLSDGGMHQLTFHTSGDRFFLDFRDGHGAAGARAAAAGKEGHFCTTSRNKENVDLFSADWVQQHVRLSVCVCLCAPLCSCAIALKIGHPGKSVFRKNWPFSGIGPRLPFAAVGNVGGHHELFHCRRWPA